VGRDLGVRAVLKGRLWRRGESLAVSAELVDTRDGAILWRDQYSRKIAELAEMEPDLARDITRQLRLQLSGDQQRRIATARDPKPRSL
jgi:TolB-like protein